MQQKCHPAWWREAVIYQVYPRSFQDSNGDGIGDLPGIVSRLDYIASLGVDTLWINPVFASPGKDNGYDISDFRRIAPEYGTMEDMEQLIKELHNRGLRIIIDMVLNHTSDQHEWFQQARTSRDNPYYDYYLWWPAEKGKPPFRCGFFDPSGEAWQYNEPTDSWYLHYFAPEQPDLNWDNPRVRQDLYAILRFWLDKGIDGFRLDAITFISKDTSWPDLTPAIMKEKYQNDWGHCYADGPHLHEYLREMRREIGATHPRDVLFLGEAPGVTVEKASLFVGDDREELDLITHFDGMVPGYIPGEFKKPDPAGYSRAEFKRVYAEWAGIADGKGWGTVYLGNHDQPRMLSRWGDDRDELRAASAKCLLTFLLTMRATPLLYNGDELGMRNIRFTNIDDYRDIETRQYFQLIQSKGGDTAGFLRDQQLAGRDNGRTPFQWSGEAAAGFSTGVPWLRINDDHVRINRDTEEKDADSVLNYTRRLLRLRRGHPALSTGDWRLLDMSDEKVFAYSRSLGGTSFLILLNLSSEHRQGQFPLSAPGARQLACNNYSSFSSAADAVALLPWQALVFVCGSG
jgi:oligo-1,6-glucosidase